MKKFLLSFAVIMSTTLFTACNNDSNGSHEYVVPVSDGVYVVCSGNSGSTIPGSLTYYDYSTQRATQKAYSAANGGATLGMTVNDALRYGDKFYIVVDGENSVFVTNAKTLKLIQRIDLTSESMLGETDGVSPRRIAAYDNKIYVSTFGGYVAAIDTVTFSLNKKYKVGSYPEGVTISNGYMFVANSDFGNGNASISMIDLTTGTEQTLRNENIRNPQEIAVAGSDIYFLDFGQFGPAPDSAQEHAGVYKISGTSASDISVTPIIPNATAMACAGYKIYAYCSVYGSSDPVSYHVYNIQSGTSTEFKPEGITFPAAIGVDPLTENVFIAAYQSATNEYGTSADWSTNGFVNVYSPSFLKIATFDCGVGPARFAFNLGSETIIY